MANPKTHFDFKAGEVLLVNKPLGWTSFDVVNKLRYAIKNRLGVKKIKVGHAGTLDPLADGLLILCTGKQTKSIELFMGLEKEYTGIIRLGNTTPSYDLETEFDGTYDTAHISRELLEEKALEMTGELDQFPPIFSAKKVKGKKAYDLARKGEKVELASKKVTISSFDIVKFEGTDIHFRISCSKGTYIRSIAHDMGKLLNSGAHLASLRREKIGAMSLEGSATVEEWIDIINKADVHIPDVN